MARSAEARLHLVVALACEARPLVAHYRLRRCAATRIPVFEGDGMALVVSGAGRVPAAAATAYLGALRPAPAAWLNVGVAGSGERPLGSLWVGNKVVERATGRSWYPPRLVGAALPGAQVTSVDSAELEFVDDSLCEMEAAGFVPTARRFATAELVQVAKVVSDNRGSPATDLDARRIERFVAAAVPAVVTLAAELLDLAARQPGVEVDTGAYESRWRFSSTQAADLTRLLRRARALGLLADERDPALSRCEDAADAAQVLARLRSWISGARPL